MKDNRREFLKKAALLSGGVGVWSVLPPALKKAMAIDPAVGSTFYDAEHVVFLMQENRSFDHCFGMLQGVRGYNDPRAIDLPNGNKVWLQKNEKGETYAPFRLNMRDTRATWMGSLPHSWENQVDARNQGKYNQWLQAKKPGNPSYQEMPLTLGYYSREDIPFYYAFADAFTVCDQHFCSSLTGTTANRMFFWTGTIKSKPGAPAWVRNSDIGYRKEVSWKTFPERLEENNISWKVYQNELSVETELTGEPEALLANFTNNNLEWFSQYNVRFSNGHYKYLLARQSFLEKELARLLSEEGKAEDPKVWGKELADVRQRLAQVKQELKRWNPEQFERLSDFQKNLHKKGLFINTEDPNYHDTESITYRDEGGEERELMIPKGDVLYGFRKDVREGKLPTVSWLVAPEYFSDHPTAPWYGAWYVSEVLDILTENPEVWKKTIFILNYDENDGYFDHVPPFVAPNPADPHTGATSSDLDSSDEFVTLEEELRKPGMNPRNARESPVGLGYRVPLIIASPWSRGGWVNSQVCDISSTLVFLEKFLNKKFGTNIREENLNSWRRAIVGDLTSAFRPYHGEKIQLPEPLDQVGFMKEIHNARYKATPKNYKNLSSAEQEVLNKSPNQSPFFPKQEKGIRNSNALPYSLEVRENWNKEGEAFELTFASKELLGNSVGAPFSVYAPGKYLQHTEDGTEEFVSVKAWDFAAGPNASLDYSWPLDSFEGGDYHLRVYGPNGFFREYKGEKKQGLSLSVSYDLGGRSKGASLLLKVKNEDALRTRQYRLAHSIYGKKSWTGDLKPLEETEISIPVHDSYNWYEVELTEQGNASFLRKVAGRIETGAPLKTDPQMGGILST